MRTALSLCVATLAACTTNQTPQPEPAPVLPSCVPNRDGKITAAELPIALGATITYYAATNQTIAQTGMRWDYSVERAEDDVIALGPIALKDQWYAASFPGGQFVVDAGNGLDGIYHQDDQALWLDGTASKDSAMASRTLIVYPQPVAVLRFPVVAGDSYMTRAALAGATINGLPFNGSDEVTVTVVGEGLLAVPYVEFSPVVRVTVLVARIPTSGPTTSRRTTLFLFECFGEVARAESKSDEPSADFTFAAYFRRFALGVTP
ncbi:MAG TPA: hypothetical protein VIV40_07610 [Kofleriaceae bacterium]